MKPRPFNLIICAALLAGVVLFPSNAPAGKEPAAKAAPPKRFEVADIAKLVNLSDPQVSPDGKSIVVVVTRANLEENRYDSALVLVDVTTSARRELTQGRKTVGFPRWSPSGDRLAFLAPGGPEKEAKLQIFVMPMNGGDPKRITNGPNDVQQFAWRPDGLDIAFITADEPANKKAMEKGQDAFEVGDNDYLAAAAPMPSHIWLVPAKGGEAKRLTSGTWSLQGGAEHLSASPLSWSPNGKQILFVRQEHPHIGDSDLTTIQILDVASGSVRSLTDRKLFEGFPSYSPDGSRIAYWYPRDGDPINVNEIWVAPAAGGEGISVTAALNRPMYQSIWMPDGKSLLVGGDDGTQVSLWTQPLDASARKFDLGAASPSCDSWVDVSVSKDGAITFIGSEARHPAELYYMESPTLTAKRLTDFNKEVAAMDLSRVEAIEWKGPDGFHENGLLYYPPGFKPGEKYPLVLHIHGGPTWASMLEFAALSQAISARGYVVFEPNYRGSDNLGNAYQRAIVNDTGDGPGRDVMAGVEAVKRLGFVDEGRIAVTGWSYGGYMTAWLIGHYSIWKCAVAGASLSDWMDQYSLADNGLMWRYGLGGSPWVRDLEKAYREQSPITYAAKMQTPTLILSDTGDVRVPISQSYKLFHALKDRGVPVKFVAYPVSGHFPGDPVRTADVFKRWIEWLDQYLGPTATVK